MENKKVRQRLFVQEYLVDCNATQAAIRAGYSKRTAKSQGQRLLTKPDVQEAVREAQEARQKRTEITADYVLNSLKEVAERCKQALPVFDREGKPTGTYRFDSAGVNRDLELLGKHLKMFTDKLEIREIRTLDDLTEEEMAHLLADVERRIAQA